MTERRVASRADLRLFAPVAHDVQATHLPFCLQSRTRMSYHLFP